MNGIDKFSAYNNMNKTPQKPKLIEKYGENMRAIFDRIPKEVLREMPVIEQSKNLKRKPYINGICKSKKPDKNRIDKKMNEQEKKILSEINNFKEIFYDYNKEQDDQMDNFEKIQDENNKFSKIYKKIQKDKGKFNTGTYLDYQPFINISSRYLSRNMKIPNLSNEHSIFSGNPLILSGSDLQDFIIYNLGNKKKAMVFLKKVDDIVNRKKTGSELTYEEKEHLANIISQEKPKGYIPPGILIPRLKNDITASNITYNNLIGIENFFKKSENKNRRIADYLSSYKYNHRSCDNIFNNSKNINPININFNNENNNLYLNKKKSLYYKNILNNSDTTGTTDIFGTRKSSIKEQSKEYTINSNNISSIVSGQNSTSKKFSPINSAFGRELYNNNNYFNEDNLTNRISSSKIEISNNSIIPKKIDIPIIDTKIKIKKKTLLNNNIKINILKEKNQLRNCASTNDFMRDLSILNDRKENNISYGSERGDIADLINNIENKNLFDQSRIISEKRKSQRKKSTIRETDTDNKQVNFNFNNNEEKNIDMNEKRKEAIKKKSLKPHKLRIIKPKTPTQKEREFMKYRNLENLFNKAVNLGFNSNKNKYELEAYIKSKGKNINRKPNKKELYFNIYKTKEKAIENNLILEEYMIRNGTNDKKSLTNEQRNILDKNNSFKNEMINCEMKFKEMLCAETIDK